MKTFLRVAIWCVVILVGVWLLIVLSVANHVQSRMDQDEFVHDVSKVLNIPRDKLRILNEPRHFRPVAIFEYMGNRSNILSRCESVIPPEERLRHVPKKDRDFALQVFEKEYARRKAKIIDDCKRYKIDLKGEILNLYRVWQDNPTIRFHEEIVVAATSNRVYVTCLISR